MRNYLHQRSKSLLAFAVGLTILSSSFAGEVYADDCYFSGSDMYNDGTTNWDEETQTATLTDNKTVGFLTIPRLGARSPLITINKGNALPWYLIIIHTT